LEIFEVASGGGNLIVGGNGLCTLTMLQGSSAIVPTTLTSGGNEGSGIFLSGNASLAVAGNSALNSALSITGPSVDFSTNGVTFGANHAYSQVFTSAAASTVSVVGDVALAGSVNLDFSGAPMPSVGDTFDLMQAGGAVSGMFGQVTSVGAGLNPGQQFIVNAVPSGSDTLVQAELINALVLRIDRDAGTMEILDPNGGSIDFDAYEVTSAVGSLNPGGFAGLASQAVAGWDEANPNSNSVGELNAQSSSVAAASTSLGNSYAPDLSTFAVHPDDHQFRYRLADGRFVDGQIEYVGTEVINDLLLVVDPTTGDGQLFNDSATPLPVDGYTIKSAGASLDAAGFTGLGGDWVNSNPSSTQLADLLADGSQTLAPGETLALGKIFNPGGSEDLTLEYLFAEGSGDGPLGGDFN
ncbi:MAG: hypothetical protein AAF961_17410, partial [Planctomycetota bacterium]